MNTADGLVVIGEVLIELSTPEPLTDGGALTLGFSGDALNAAAAAARAGARVRLLTRVADDELGDLLVKKVEAFGIDTSLVRRTAGQNGVYFVSADPTGSREFCYARLGSTASTLVPGDLPDLTGSLVLSSGITCAISVSAADTVLAAARSAGGFVYDPNFRPRLTSPEQAAAMLAALAPYADLVTPAFPAETTALLGAVLSAGLGAGTPEAALRALRGMGARRAVVTRGGDGVVVDDGTVIPAPPAPALVDQTGAGDVFTGTVAARLSLGDELFESVRLGAAAAALSLSGQGGTGHLASLAETRALLAKEE
jgi:2-dehydro-3-deoxygluconokinase